MTELGLTDDDKQRIQEYLESDTDKPDILSPNNDTKSTDANHYVDLHECARMQHEILAGKIVAQVSREYNRGDSTVRYHLHGRCEHNTRSLEYIGTEHNGEWLVSDEL